MKSREDHIEFDMNYCQHYAPQPGSLKADYCALAHGANERMQASRKAGEPNMSPCIGGHKAKDVVALCPHWIRRTREMGEQRADAMAKAMQKMMVADEFVSKWRVQPKPKTDRAEVVECPVCKGRLHLRQAAYNGHCRVCCETEDCVNWIE